VPLDPEGIRVGWYACGPTVYDDAVGLPSLLGVCDEGVGWLWCLVARDAKRREETND